MTGEQKELRKDMGEKIEVMTERLEDLGEAFDGVGQMVDDKIAAAVDTKFDELKAQGVAQAATSAANFDQLMAVMMSLKK